MIKILEDHSMKDNATCGFVKVSQENMQYAFTVFYTKLFINVIYANQLNHFHH